jgi:DNA integrity scanning protein DisA with diadenylate cyclase activity
MGNGYASSAKASARTMSMDLSAESSVFDKISRRVSWCRPDVLNAVLELAVEIAREGREGRRIGTLLTIGSADEVLAHSRPLILDPLAGYVPHATSIFDPSLRGTLKELAQLDGAFVLAEDGTVRAACRYLDATTEGIEVPFGLGSRHLAAASISKRLVVVAVVVSESAIVRVFHGGEMIAEIIPELWLLRRHMQSHLRGRITEQHVDDLAIFTTDAVLVSGRELVEGPAKR